MLGLQRRTILAIVAAAFGAATIGATPQQSGGAPYFPPRNAWPKEAPAALGLDKTTLDRAVAFALAHESTTDRDLAKAKVAQFANEAPYNALIGPTQVR